ncbi:MAG: hypothetical protein WBI36_06380 [Erysipelotrichaceae bacterium]
MSIIKESNSDLGEIPIIDKVFPEDEETIESIRNSLNRLEKLINQLFDSAKKLEKLKKDFSHIRKPNHLIVNEVIKEDPVEVIKPSTDEIESLSVSSAKIDEYKRVLEELKHFFSNHPILDDRDSEIEKMNIDLDQAVFISKLNEKVSEQISKTLNVLNEKNTDKNREITQIKKDRDSLYQYVSQSIKALELFYNSKKQLSEFNVTFETKEIVVAGHTLSIKNSFRLTEDELITVINNHLLSDYRLKDFQQLEPSTLEVDNFSQRPKVKSHEDFANKVYKHIEGSDKKEYQITTRDGKNYRHLSPGWKSAVILDLILGYENNSAPIIIDQPEDNLATNYINHDLIEMIKKIKEEKQVILVSHNATIPMLGDAQNVIICENDAVKINICSATLESEIHGKKTLDWIAELTDGGKSSIKKRVKKYNFRNYMEGQ